MDPDMEAGAGLSAFVLTMNLFLLLLQKGSISQAEAREVVDLGLLNLEEHERLAGTSMQAAVRASRSILNEIARRL